MTWTIKKVMNGYVLTRTEVDVWDTVIHEYVFSDSRTMLLHLTAALTEYELGPDAIKGYQEFDEDRSLD